MVVEHEGRSPTVDSAAWIAPTAVLCGDVRVASAAGATRRYAELFGRHRDDTVVG